MVWDINKKLLFIHIPKTGGSTIEQHMNAFNNISKGYKRTKENKAMQHFSIIEYNKLGQFDIINFYKFSIVRNPYTKILSEYYWTNLPMCYKDNRTFNYFLNAVEDIVKNKNYNYTFLHDHFIPQKDFITDEYNNIIIDKIFKFEEYNECILFLKYYYPNIQPTIHNKINTSKDVNFRITLTTLQKKKIYELYKDDFILFNYEE